MDNRIKQLVKERLAACFKRELNIETLDCRLVDIITSYSNSKGLNFESILIGYIAVIAHLCNQSSINITGEFKEICSLYCLLVGLPSTKKSFCVSLLKDSLLQMEENLNVTDEESRLNNSATIESLLEDLSVSKSLMQIWDEFGTLVNSFGLYKNGSGSYDRSVFLTLYSGTKLYKHTTKKAKLRIKEPRLSLFAADHPQKVIKMLDEEQNMENNSDGFISRFLLAAPRPIRINILQLKPLDVGLFCFENIFRIASLLHSVKRTFEFNEDAKKMVADTFDVYDQKCEKYEIENSFISYVYGKAHGHLLRLCSVLKTSSMVMQLLQNHLGPISDLRIADDLVFVIDTDIVKSAIELNKYFIDHKLILSGIKYDETDTECANNTSFELEKSILLTQGRVVFLQDLKNKCNKDTFSNVSQKLEKKKLGTLSNKKVQSNDGKQSRKTSTSFSKTDVNKLDESSLLDVINHLLKYGISLEEYKKAFGEPSKRRNDSESSATSAKLSRNFDKSCLIPEEASLDSQRIDTSSCSSD